jgi:quinol monooxygenase YgiN
MRLVIGLGIAVIMAGSAIGVGTVARQEKNVAEQLIDRLNAAGLQDEPFGLVVLFKTKKDKVEAMQAAAAKVQAPSQAESLCVQYTIRQDAENPTEFVLYEQWKNQEGLKKHFETAHFQALAECFGDVLDSPPQVRILRKGQ